MRILMLTDLFPPVIGGTELHVAKLGVELASRGHDVAVATLWQQGAPESETWNGVRVYRLRGTMQRVSGLFSHPRRTYAPPFPDPEMVLALRRLIVVERPDVVHAHNWLVRSFLPLKNWSGASLVVSLHDSSLVCAKKSFVHHEMLCEGPGLGKCLTCASDHYGPVKGVTTVVANRMLANMERALVDMYLPVSKAVVTENRLLQAGVPFEVIPNFVSDQIGLQSAPPDAYSRQLPDEEFLLFVGALGQHKGLDVLLRAYAELHAAPPLVLIGPEWPDTPKELPPNVIVLKDWPNEGVLAAWQRCLLALAPSICPDSCPTVVLEAMAFGRPVVASNIGGFPDLVADGETGLLVSPGDWAQLKQAILRLLDDEKLRNLMGQAARRKVVQFRASSVVPRIVSAYERVVTATRGLPAAVPSRPGKRISPC